MSRHRGAYALDTMDGDFVQQGGHNGLHARLVATYSRLCHWRRIQLEERGADLPSWLVDRGDQGTSLVSG